MTRTPWILRLAGLTLAASTAGLLVTGSPSLTRWMSATGAHLAFATVLALVSRALPWRFGERAGALFILAFAVIIVNVGIEIGFFSTTSGGELALFIIVGGGIVALYAVCAAFLFPPDSVGGSARQDMASHLRSRSTTAWIWRAGLASFAYILLYLVVGGIAFQFTRPYYTDPSYGLNLTVPSLQAVLLAQCLRAPIFVAAVWPFLAGANLSRGRGALLAGTALFILGGLTPLLANSAWPPALRLYHTVEIFFQNAPAGFVIAWLTSKATNSIERPLNEVRTPAYL